MFAEVLTIRLSQGEAMLLTIGVASWTVGQKVSAALDWTLTQVAGGGCDQSTLPGEGSHRMHLACTPLGVQTLLNS